MAHSGWRYCRHSESRMDKHKFSSQQYNRDQLLGAAPWKIDSKKFFRSVKTIIGYVCWMGREIKMKMFGCPKPVWRSIPFLLKRDYSIGEKKKIGFVRSFTSIVFLARRDGNAWILNVDKNGSTRFIYELEVIRTLSWIIFFSWEKKFQTFIIPSSLLASFFLELNWPEILFAAIVHRDKRKWRKEMFLSFATSTSEKNIKEESVRNLWHR